MPITSSDFFVLRPDIGSWSIQDNLNADLTELDRDRLTALVERPDEAHGDLDVSLALMDLVRDDLLLSGTQGGELLADVDMRLAIRALERVTSRAGHPFKLPFRDHSGWKSWWNHHSAYGSWQARRDLLSQLFDEPYAALMAAQDRALDSTLADAISPHDRLDWPEVDTEIGELRRHFRTASTPQDYRAVGNDCVHLTEALSRKVYDHAVHGPTVEAEPPVPQAKLRLTRYIEARLPGPDNVELRKFARAVIRTRSSGEALRCTDTYRSGDPRGCGHPSGEHASAARRGIGRLWCQEAPRTTGRGLATNSVTTGSTLVV